MKNDISHPPEHLPTVAPPMEAPTVILLVLGVGAALLLTGLMVTDFVWTAQHPVTIAAPASPPAHPQG